MKILDRYILFKLLRAFFFVVFILISIVVIINFTERNEDYIKHGLSFKEIAGYYIDYIPYMANMLTPMTIFIAAVFITSQLATHTEVIAMLSSGMSFFRFLVPYFIGASIIAIITFASTGWVIPNANKTRVAFEVAYFNAKKSYGPNHDMHIKIGPTSYLYLESYNNQNDIGYKLTIETIKGTKLTQKLEAQRILWNADSGRWSLKNWRLHEFDGLKEHFSSGLEMDTTLKILPKDFGNQYMLYETLTMNELDEKISELESRGADNISVFRIEKYIRYMSPFAAIILTFIGAIVSAQKTRGGTGFQVALGFLLAFIYIILYVFARSIAEVETMNPAFAVWIPNIIFVFVGIFLYIRYPK